MATRAHIHGPGVLPAADDDTPDGRLRAAGFRVVGRPKVGPATWEKDGRSYTQEQAERVVDLGEREGAKG